jgi:leucine dehydrogenase
VTAFWESADFDEHERVELVHDRASGLTAIIAIHSSHLGPGAGGTRFWHYPDPEMAMRDALRLSRGMSYKNAMAVLPMGGGKGVILANPARDKTPAMMTAYGRAIEALGGAYIAAEDVGMTEPDMASIAAQTSFVTGLPAEKAGEQGGDPGPYTSHGVFLGVREAVRVGLGKTSLSGVHVAIQGTGSVGGGLARHLAAAGARLTLADIDKARAARLAEELGATAVPAEAIMQVECDVFSPCALGAIFDDESIAALRAPVVAGGANNQLARPEHGDALMQRGILYAPDYVINAGGIIAVTYEYLARRDGTARDVSRIEASIAGIPERLTAIWERSRSEGTAPSRIADAMAQKLIGRD